ncbi:uncharacterized protein LOC102809661 [Saccoglossus kowalevskii]|uniref:Uncharacterized protein LOC102809661 n=1 Tax=Saccoglossus kowalevskii TaxID=10224 RepID=A0ABM0LV50_SACKO|nr:PREDICTED: uncharacterized protein LOC102809661 [Saccoglossus kowalevskii]
MPAQSEYPIEITSQDPVTTETSNIIGPPIEHRTVIGVENDYSVVEGIAIAGLVVAVAVAVAAVLGIFIIGYFCVARVGKSEHGICCRRGRIHVSTRQTEEGMKSPATTSPVVPIVPVTPGVTPVVTPTTIDSENTKNIQQETPLRREKPPVPQKPKNYAASINDRWAVNDQRASSLSQNRRSQPHESFKDVSGELKYMFIHSNGSHTQQQGIGPTRGGKVAHV